MKVYSIGRDFDCSIVIDDNTDVISRRHAILNVSPWGKMTIVDQSHNGTYVNGIRISSNVPVPVTRKDNISFAHIARLDWNRVPRVYNPLIYVGISIAVILIILMVVWGVNVLRNPNPTPNPIETVTLTPEQLKHQQDSIRDAAIQQAKDDQEKQRLKDSIDAETAKKVAKAKVDSILRARKDSINRINVKVPTKCKYCGEPIEKCPNKGRKHKVEGNSEKKDTTKRFR